MLRATDGRTFFPAAEAEFYLDDICGITDQAGRVEFRNIGSVDRVITVPDGIRKITSPD